MSDEQTPEGSTTILEPEFKTRVYRAVEAILEMAGDYDGSHDRDLAGMAEQALARFREKRERVIALEEMIEWQKQHLDAEFRCGVDSEDLRSAVDFAIAERNRCDEIGRKRFRHLERDFDSRLEDLREYAALAEELGMPDPYSYPPFFIRHWFKTTIKRLREGESPSRLELKGS